MLVPGPEIHRNFPQPGTRSSHLFHYLRSPSTSMIERYSITAPAEQLAERFSIDVPDYYRSRYNAAPMQLLPVITSASPKGLSLFYWGTSPEWSKNKMPSEKNINTRTEQLDEKPALKRALMKTRCIIPADGFYAWKKVGKKTSIPYRFVLTTRDIFSFAGIWEEFEDTDGNEIQTFNIITTPANNLVNTVHDRMPVILTKEFEKNWLDSACAENEILECLQQYPDNFLSYYPVSAAISNMDKDVASLILPTPPVDQHGNLTLFD
jgi:putative SOS response-associated peptidase YedK